MQGNISKEEAFFLVDAAAKSFGAGWKSAASRSLPLSVVDLSRATDAVFSRPNDGLTDEAFSAAPSAKALKPPAFVFHVPKQAAEPANLLRVYIQVGAASQSALRLAP